MVVSTGDVVYHLGDVAWHKKAIDTDILLAHLNGTKILITGNHDKGHVKKCGSQGLGQGNPNRD